MAVLILFKYYFNMQNKDKEYLNCWRKKAQRPYKYNISFKMFVNDKCNE